MKFILSYSCGKDSTLALHRMLQQGHEPLALLVMINQELGRSWFHGVDPALLKKLSQALKIPLLLCQTKGEAYHTAMEKALRTAKEMGAEACVFGDIDLEDNAKWCRERCFHTGLQPVFPLWGESREALVEECVALGYRAIIKCVKNDCLSPDLLGKTLNSEVLAQLKAAGVDVCGENGEYHTLVVDGPSFHQPVGVVCKQKLEFGAVTVINIELLSETETARLPKDEPEGFKQHEKENHRVAADCTVQYIDCYGL